jgi:membrane protein DedA with SNARE-associated domain
MKEALHRLLVPWMHFVLDWGYVGIVIMMAFESTAVPIPAEIVIPPAAYWASQGKLNIVGVVIAATFGSWLGSAISYWVSYKLGRPLIERYGKYVLMSQPKIEKADAWFAEYGAGGIFVARLLPGIRHVISIPAGVFRMNFLKFSIMTVAGAGIFCSALAWFGQKVLGDRPELLQDPNAMIDALHEKVWYLVGFGVVVGILYYLMHVMQKRAAAKRSSPAS